MTILDNLSERKRRFFEQIAKELATGRAALKAGNEGMVRVCARRAAGRAITLYVTLNNLAWPPDAMAQLRLVAANEVFPRPARDAATRLTTKITEQFIYPFSTDPLADAQIIIDSINTMIGTPEAGTPGIEA